MGVARCHRLLSVSSGSPYLIRWLSHMTARCPDELVSPVNTSPQHTLPWPNAHFIKSDSWECFSPLHNKQVVMVKACPLLKVVAPDCFDKYVIGSEWNHELCRSDSSASLDFAWQFGTDYEVLDTITHLKEKHTNNRCKLCSSSWINTISVVWLQKGNW